MATNTDPAAVNCGGSRRPRTTARPGAVRRETHIRDASYRSPITEDRPHRGRDVLISADAGNWSPRAGRHAGEFAVIRSVFNAGFRGIIALVELDTPDDLGSVMEISVGAIELA